MFKKLFLFSFILFSKVLYTDTYAETEFGNEDYFNSLVFFVTSHNFEK